MMLPDLLLQVAQNLDPMMGNQCLITGVCNSGPPVRLGPQSGLMFLAVGLVWLGIAGLLRRDRRH